MRRKTRDGCFCPVRRRNSNIRFSNPKWFDCFGWPFCTGVATIWRNLCAPIFPSSFIWCVPNRSRKKEIATTWGHVRKKKIKGWAQVTVQSSLVRSGNVSHRIKIFQTGKKKKKRQIEEREEKKRIFFFFNSSSFVVWWNWLCSQPSPLFHYFLLSHCALLFDRAQFSACYFPMSESFSSRWRRHKGGHTSSKKPRSTIIAHCGTHSSAPLWLLNACHTLSFSTL